MIYLEHILFLIPFILSIDLENLKKKFEFFRCYRLLGIYFEDFLQILNSYILDVYTIQHNQ